MESKKPKLFISQPMHGKSDEEILAEREEAAKKATSLVKRDKEVPKMPKMYEIWKDENGEAHGRDCETGRTFVISEETFERVEYCAKKPRVGDIVYINNLTGVKPYEVTFVQNIAKRLNDDLLMLRYTYGYYPNFDTRDQNQRLWKVLYVGTAHSLIEEHSTGTRSMICVCDNDSLTVSENQKDDEPF